MSKRDWESDTASEEDEPNQDLSIESKLTEERSTENALNLERFDLRDFLGGWTNYAAVRTGHL